MVVIRIPVSLERRLCKQIDLGIKDEANEILREVWDLITTYKLEREKKREVGPNKEGLSYKKIVAILKEEMADKLRLPPNPSTAWIVRQVLRVKDLGLNEQQLQSAGRNAVRYFNDGVDLEYFLRAITKFIGPTDIENPTDSVNTRDNANILIGR